MLSNQREIKYYTIPKQDRRIYMDQRGQFRLCYYKRNFLFIIPFSLEIWLGFGNCRLNQNQMSQWEQTYKKTFLKVMKDTEYLCIYQCKTTKDCLIQSCHIIKKPNKENQSIQQSIYNIHLKVNNSLIEQKILDMAARMTKRLQKEYESIKKTNPDLKVSLPTNDLTLWLVDFQGAKGTLYEGENFTLQLKFNNDYPIQAPEVIFVKHVPVHEHIYSNGFICLSILYDQWSPALTVSSICLSVLSMLSSAPRKIKPANDAEFVKRSAGRGPKSFTWSYHDDKA